MKSLLLIFGILATAIAATYFMELTVLTFFLTTGFVGGLLLAASYWICGEGMFARK